MKIFTILFILLLSKVESTTYGKNEEEWKSKIVANDLIFENDDKLDKLPPSAKSPNEASWKDDGTEEKPISTSKNEKIMPKIDYEPSIELDSSLIISQSFVNKKMLDTKLDSQFDIDNDEDYLNLLLAQLSLLDAIAQNKVPRETQIIANSHYDMYCDDFCRIDDIHFYKNYDDNELYFLSSHQEGIETKLILIKLLMSKEDFIKRFNLDESFKENIEKLSKYKPIINKDSCTEDFMRLYLKIKQSNLKDYLNIKQNNLFETRFFKCLNAIIDFINDQRSNDQISDYENIKKEFPELVNSFNVDPVKIEFEKSEMEQLFSLKQKVKTKDGKSSCLSKVDKIKISTSKLKEDSDIVLDRFEKIKMQSIEILEELMKDYFCSYASLIGINIPYPLLCTFKEDNYTYILMRAKINYSHVTFGLNTKLHKVVIVELLPATQSDLSEMEIEL